MNSLQANLQIITPCFCAGANQQLAEIRVPSIRGQLRWWFRVLGGNRQLEREIFGGITGVGQEEEKPLASKVNLRLLEVNNVFGEEKDLPKDAFSSLYYLFYYAHVSGKRDGIRRYRKYGWLAPGTRFSLQATFRLPLTGIEQKAFLQTWKAFLLFGSLGLRQTRGMGALADMNGKMSWDEYRHACQTVCPQIKSWYASDRQGKPILCDNWQDAMSIQEAALGWIRQNGFSAGHFGDNPTPLGKSKRGRQASALHLRPVLLKEGYLPALFYTPTILAPRNQDSRLTGFLQDREFKVPYIRKRSQSGADRRNSLFLRLLK